jgi:hypothetical protein
MLKRFSMSSKNTVWKKPSPIKRCNHGDYWCSGRGMVRLYLETKLGLAREGSPCRKAQRALPQAVSSTKMTSILVPPMYRPQPIGQGLYKPLWAGRVIFAKDSSRPARLLSKRFALPFQRWLSRVRLPQFLGKRPEGDQAANLRTRPCLRES